MHTGLGLHITRRLLGSGSGASALLAGETDGLAFDFTNQSALIRDTSTPANAYNSIGIVNDGALVGPSGKLTYTSPSNKLTMQSDGVMRYQAHNLIPYSDDLAISGWSRFRCTLAVSGESYDGTTAQVMTLDTTADATHGVFQAFAGVSGAQYVLSVIAKAGTASYIYVGGAVTGYTYSYFDLSLGVAGDSGTNQQGSITALGGGWYRCDVLCTSTTGTPDFYVGISQGASIDDEIYDGTPAGTETVYLLRAHVYRYPANTDYIRTSSSAVYALPLEYSATDGSCLGLLVEEQRTNVWLNSRTQSGANVGANALLNSGITTSVFNDTTHKVINENATTADRFFYYRNITGLTSSGQYCVSVVSKAVDRDYISLSMRPGAASNGYRALFNLATGAFVSEGSVGAGLTSTGYGIEDVGNGWYRVYITANIGANTNCYFEIGASSSASPSYVSNMAYYNGTAGTDAIEVDQTQVELGAFPTSPIITYGASASRLADNISIATSAFPYSGAAGTLYAYAKTVNNTSGTAKILASLDDGTSNERALLWYHTNDPKALIVDGGSTQLDQDLGTWAVDTSGKIALAYALNDCSSVFDGGTVYSDTSATMPTVDRLSVGSQAGSSFWNSHIKAISYVPRRKDDIELAVDTGYSLPTGYTTYGAWDLFGTESSALAFDFTDQSVVNTKTPLVSQGIVSDGELVGPGAALTYTSPSNKLTRQSDGYYKYQAHNLCLQSEDFTTTWANDGTTDSANTIAAPDGNSTADTITEVAASSRHIVYQTNTSGVAGAIMRLSVYLKSGTAQYAAIGLHDNAGVRYTVVIDLSNGTIVDTESVSSPTNTDSSVVDVGDGWYLCTVQQTVTHGTIFPTIGISGSAAPTYALGMPTYLGTNKTLYVWGAHVYRYPANTDYIKTTSAAKYALPLEYDTSGTCLGLLVEEARTNLLLYNTQFDNAAWTETNIATISAGSVVAPNGLAEAETLTASAGAAVHGVQNTAALTISTGNYTWSAYVKAGTHSYINIQINIGSEQFISAVFDLSGGGSAATETDVGITTGSIESTFQESVGNGWYRIGIVGALTTSSACTVRFSFAEAATGNTFSTFGSISWTAAGTETFSIWGAQVEAGSFPTSPILTYGAAASRLVDNISIATSAFPHSDATQSVYVSYTPNFASDGGVRNVVSLNNGGNTEIIYILSDDSVGRNKFTITDGGVAQCDITNTASPPVAGTEQKLALSYAANDIAACVNGGTVQTDTSATMPTVTQLNIGARYSATQHIGSGIVTQLSAVPRAKSDAELQTETS